MNDDKALRRMIRHINKAYGYYMLLEQDLLTPEEEATFLSGLRTAGNVIEDLMLELDEPIRVGTRLRGDEDEIRIGGTD